MFGDELDAQAGRAERAPKATRTAEEIVGEARELILKSRAALAAVAPPPNMAIAEKDGWFEQAVAIWGPRVADAKPSSWEVYVQSRLSHPPPPESPYLLMQEFFATGKQRGWEGQRRHVHACRAGLPLPIARVNSWALCCAVFPASSLPTHP